MRDLLPPEVAVAVAVADADDYAGELLPAEQACLGARAVESRRRDFTAGRVCARRALAQLGVRGVAVPSAANRAPVWPAGLVGTITHTRGYCAAAVARADEVRSVGMDAERHRELNAGVRRLIGLPEEWDDIARLPDGVPWPVVLFSAKETVYKVWHPVVGTWLDFHDARITFDPASGLFTAQIVAARLAAAPVPDPPATITGRFTVEDDLIRTAAALLPG